MNVILYLLVCEKIKLPNLYPKLTWNLHQVLISIIVLEFYILTGKISALLYLVL